MDYRLLVVGKGVGGEFVNVVSTTGCLVAMQSEFVGFCIGDSGEL